MLFFSYEEWASLFRRVESAVLKNLFAFMLETGLRFGEATSLKSSDLTVQNQIPSVRVNRAWKKSEDGIYFMGAPKTSKMPSHSPLGRPDVERHPIVGRECPPRRRARLPQAER